MTIMTNFDIYQKVFFLHGRQVFKGQVCEIQTIVRDNGQDNIIRYILDYRDSVNKKITLDEEWIFKDKDSLIKAL